jgi:hypothetical protein
VEVATVNEGSEAFLERTIKFWQERSNRHFTEEDARAAIENISGFFDVLHQWAAPNTVIATNSKTEIKVA